MVGQIGTKDYEKELTLDLGAPAIKHEALPSVWARAKIERLSQEMLFPKHRVDNRKLIRELALEYGLMSSYTSFVAVDSLKRTEGRHGTTVPVAVPVPKGVKYETAVGSSGTP